MISRNIYYDILKSEKLGNILIAATDVGLLKIEFPVVGDTPRALFRKIESEAKVRRDRSKLKDVARQLREFFQGRRRSFEVKFDLHKSTAFSRRVLLKTSKIRYGRTVTYGELARRCGCPGGARAIGQVMAKNPLPIIIPCHRVLASDGKLGGYSGGLKYKRILLDLEGRKI
jgi:methylated-DNA-[protein]-cysteine S-methyltransferase